MKEVLKRYLSESLGFEAIAQRALRTITILVLAYALYKAGVFLLDRFKPREKEAELTEDIRKRKRALTTIILLKNVFKYLLFFICGFVVLRGLGVDPVPLIAAAGVIGFAIGFGAQSLVKDVVSGFFIIFEEQYSVGDFVHVKGPSEAIGVVEEFGLRMTTIRNLDGNLHYISNGTITGVDRFDRGYLLYNLDFTLPVGVEEGRAEGLIGEIGKELVKEYPLILSAPKMVGVIPLAAERVLVRLRAQIIPSQEWVVEECARSVSEELKTALKLPEVPFRSYRINEKAIAAYKKTIHLR